MQIDCIIPGVDAYFTIDPLDGTKAFTRRQSHGTSTMISMVLDDEIIAVCIGDINTQEIYCYRPFSPHVHRITEYEKSERLSYNRESLKDSCVILREDPRKFSPIIRDILLDESSTGIFKDVEITGGSIGMSMSRLWKGECSVAILAPSTETPWDSTPIIGITQKMDFDFYVLKRKEGLIKKPTSLIKEVLIRDEEVIILHETAFPELRDYLLNHIRLVK